MSSVTVSEAQKHLSGLLDSVAESHAPLLISTKKNTGVLVSDDDWQAIQETLFLPSNPGMVESIEKGHATPFDQMSKNPADEPVVSV